MRTKSVSRLAVLAAALSLSACGLTPTQQKKWTGVAAGVLIVGAIAAHQQDNGAASSAVFGPPPTVPCHPQPNGSCR